jgi:hypothetical protein
VPSYAGNVRDVWNKVVKDFLASKSEWLFSTHDDIIFEPKTLIRLLSWDKPLISALVFMRHSPVTPHIWRNYTGRESYYAQRINDTREWFYKHVEYIRFGPFVMDERPDDALTEIDFTSTSCTLIHRSVLEGMKEFIHEDWFVWDDDVLGGGEDRRFFTYAKIAGFQGYVDRSCVAGHVAGDIPSSVADFIAWDSISTFNGTGEPETKSLETAQPMESQ